MRVPLCHHYWQNGQNATWAPPVFPVPEIEAALKNDYLFLQQARPASRQYGAYTVFFDYRPDIDAFGRQIVPISFAFCKTGPDLEAMAPRIRKALAKAGRDQFFIDLREAPAGQIPEAPKKAKPQILWLLLVILAALSLVWKFGCADNGEHEGEQRTFAAKTLQSRPDTAAPGPKKTLREDPADTAAADPEYHGENRQKAIGRTPQIVEKQSGQIDICQRPELWQNLLNCPRAFVEKRCAGKLAKNFRAFRETDPACRPAYGKLEPWSEKLPIFTQDAQIAQEDAENLTQFVFKRP